MASRKATRPVADKVEIEEEEAPSTGLDAVAALAMQGTPCSPAVLQPGSGQTRTDSDRSLVGDAPGASSGHSNVAMGRQSSLSSTGSTSSPKPGVDGAPEQPGATARRSPGQGADGGALTWEQARNRWEVGHGGDAGGARESQWGVAPPPESGLATAPDPPSPASTLPTFSEGEGGADNGCVHPTSNVE